MSVTLGDQGLSLMLRTENGPETAYFNYFWLRDNCPTAWDPVTQERTFDILSEPDDLKPLAASEADEQLHIHWPTGHHSRYPLQWLARWHCRPDQSRCLGHGDPAVRARRSWYADHYAQLHRADFNALQHASSARASWAEALLDEGIALVTGMPNDETSLTTLCELIGPVRPSLSGYAFNVRTEQKPVNLAYTAAALELHTDLPPEELPPGIQFLHCLVNDAEGGESLFVDATSVAKALQAKQPAYFELLTQVSIPFRYTAEGQDVRARQYVIELDPDNGEVSGISFSQHLSDVFDLPQHQLDQFYPAFRYFGRLLQDPAYLMRFRLNAGECIVFDNHRVAHGRSAFVAGSGARHLRGCYVDRGDLRSAYRAWQQQQQALSAKAC